MERVDARGTGAALEACDSRLARAAKLGELMLGKLSQPPVVRDLARDRLAQIRVIAPISP